MRGLMIAAAVGAIAAAGEYAAYTLGYNNALDDQHWEDVMVFQDGTLVPNPAAMSARDLSHTLVVDRTPNITLVKCGARWVVNGDCKNWREIRYAK